MSGHPRLAGVQQGTASAALPLALAPAARIQERDWEDFLLDPTQLTNGLRDLRDAVDPSAVPVTSVTEILAAGEQLGQLLGTAQEATRRLVTSFGDRTAIAALLPGPKTWSDSQGISLEEGVSAVVDMGKGFLEAGAHLLVLDERADGGSKSPGTLVNIANFRQALVLALGEIPGITGAHSLPLDAEDPVPGLNVTEGELPRDTDISALEDWVENMLS